MRILQVCPYAWSARGGVQAHVRQLSMELGDRGHEVLVLTAGDRARSASAHAPRVREVGPCVRVRFNRSVAPLCLHGARAVRHALWDFRPHVVHVHELLAPSLPGLATLLAGVPVVATFHANCTPLLDRLLYSVMARCLRPMSRRVAVGLAVSQAAATCAAPRLGGSLRIVPNGVDIEPFAHARPMRLPPGRKLLFVSRLDRRKGFPTVLRAFEWLAPRFDDLRLVVCGDGPRRGAVDRLPAVLHNRVLMLGDVPDRDLPSVYAAADVFVAPAAGQESFGVILLEAMAAGLPIVASDIDGYREVVADGGAWLVPPGDDRSLARALGCVLDSPGLARQLASAGRRHVRQFAWKVVTDEIERAYGQAIVAAVEPVPPQARVTVLSLSR